MSARGPAAAELAARIGHAFADPALLERALTHASVGQGARKVASNERLEFLGDRVLNLVVAEALFRRFPDESEGELALRINSLVDARTCAEVARAWDIGPALRLPGGETRRGARDQEVFLADACEAVVAAVYLDAGFDAAQALVLAAWGPRLDLVTPARVTSPKTRLQEWALGAGKPLPRYAVLDRTGPDHEPTFRVGVLVEGHEAAEGFGRSRQAAETAAAAALLEREGVA